MCVLLFSTGFPDYLGQPVCGSRGVILSAFRKYTFCNTVSGRSIPYSFQKA
jgi:hypothetical protein